MNLIGSNANMQFEDMNARDMRRPYKKYIQRIDEMERILRFLFDELSKIPGAEVTKNRVDDFLEHDHEMKLDVVETELKDLYTQFIGFKGNNTDLNEQRNAAIEEKYVMQTATMTMSMGGARGQARGAGADDDSFDFQASRSLLEEEGAPGRSVEMMFSNIAGVLPQAEQERFARTLFRATRGNTFTHFQQIPDPLNDPKTGKEVFKSVFVVYYQDNRLGSASSAMSDKIRKICSSFGVNTYRWPSNREDADRRRAFLTKTLEEKVRALDAYERFVRSEAAVMLEPARAEGNSLVEEWRLFCIKEKSIYASLNLFEGDITLRANCWYPASEEEHIRQTLIRQSNQQQTSAMLVSDRTSTKKNPPTYIRRNAFTEPFQELIDTYGVPSYGEANPALLTCVTFPFLFGIMYGDIGHGLMLFLAGIWMIFNAESLRYSAPGLFMGRYMITMMGFFAIYAGFLYNDFFSLGLNIFGSRWKFEGNHDDKMHFFQPDYDIKNNGGAGPYPFGIDPAWHGSTNELLFMNSLKMKVSVLFGVTQMTVGILLRFSNSVSTSNYTDFFCECVPMMMFMICFFGYMDFLIMYKWVTPMDNPPSIINSLICMAMGQPDKAPMFDGAIFLSQVLMIISMLTVPWMLIPKPLIIWMGQRNSGHGGQGGGHRALAADDEEGKLDEDEAHHDMGEIVIHQIIETIEYVLGTVSHTASYLRLWALSLAHQQLSLVFFQKTILAVLGLGFPLNAIALWFAYACWFGITCGILLGMDCLECFLHTLRLHWVEFQSKFYKAEGYSFTPYRHKTLLEPTAE